MEEIDLKEIIGIFWDKKSTIILLIAIFMVLGFIYSSFIVVPKYSSSTKLVLAQSVNKEDGGSITTTDITLNSKLISTYTGIIESSKVIRQVISNLQIEDKEQSIRSNVSVSAEAGTDIIKITVTNINPERAADIANEMAVVFAEEVKRLYGMDNINTLDPAEVSNSPSNVNLTKTIIIFGAVGCILAVGYIFVGFMLDNSIKSQEDIEKSMNIPVLANIPIYGEENIKARTNGKNRKKAKGGKRR
jgi:capsular polysaccharide biosynthesis protein